MRSSDPNIQGELAYFAGHPRAAFRAGWSVALTDDTCEYVRAPYEVSIVGSHCHQGRLDFAQGYRQGRSE